MNIRFCGFALLFPLALGAGPLQAQAVQDAAVVEENAEERINFSGKLQMLSQRVPSAACHLNRGIDVDGAGALLAGATAEFEKILAGLELGDADLNLQQAETRRKTLFAIAELRDHWEPMKDAALAVADGTATTEEIEVIFAENMLVLRYAQRLVEELVKQYANPNATTRSQLMQIDIAGRQRMLTQKMSKETCLIGSSYETETTADDLAGTVGIFEASLEALRFGMPVVGIAPPPNPAILDGLGGVHNDWSAVKPYISQTLAGTELDEEASTIKFQGLNVTMANMNAVVGMYVAATKD
jgi:hypothetical protein